MCLYSMYSAIAESWSKCMHRAKEAFHLVILLCPCLHTCTWQRDYSYPVLVRCDYLYFEKIKKQDPSQLNILWNLQAKQSSTWSKTPSPSTQKPLLPICIQIWTRIFRLGKWVSSWIIWNCSGDFGETYLIMYIFWVHAIFLSSV